MVVLVMGVSGVGKSTVGQMLAAALAARFLDGDDFHPAANRTKMAAGHALDDSDRAPWLASIAAELALARTRGETVVLACSALKQRYRDILAAGQPDLRVVWLHGAAELIATRIASRSGHFMPAALLDSQLAILEPPGDALVFDVSIGADDIVASLLPHLARQRCDEIHALGSVGGTKSGKSR